MTAHPDRGQEAWFGTVVVLAALTVVTVLGAVTVSSGERPMASTQPAAADDETLVATFVLAPIRTQATGFPVPADVFGPLTNNSCQGWKGKAQSCYMPSHVHGQHAPPEMPWLRELLEEHLSAVLEAWNVGAWPPDGASLIYDLDRYHALTHLWLSMRIDIRQEVGAAWLTGTGDPEAAVNAAATQPAASIDIEVFGSTRGAEGYPRRRGL